MHFGKIVKRVALSQGLSAQDLAELLGQPERSVLEWYEQEEWSSNKIKSASAALDHDFGKYLNNSFKYDFMRSDESESREFMIVVRYPKGKEFLLKTWLDKLKLIARTIGLEVGK